jgi:hypothetical protein
MDVDPCFFFFFYCVDLLPPLVRIFRVMVYKFIYLTIVCDYKKRRELNMNSSLFMVLKFISISAS